MSEIREWLQAASRAIKRWSTNNKPADAGLGLQWEFQHLGKQINELSPNWRKGDLLFNVLDEEAFKASGIQEVGKVETVESVFEGQPSMTVFTITAETYFQLNRKQLEALHAAAKPINK